MTREIKQAKTIAYTIPVPADTDAVEWLKAQAPRYTWLLAHSETGVTWGIVRNDKLVMPEASAPILNKDTLWQARLFGAQAELLLWRDGDGGFHARILGESTSYISKDATFIAEYAEYFDEAQILWGDTATPADDKGFTLMTDGTEGLEYVVPLPQVIVRNSDRPMRLDVRHYLNEDGTGFKRIVASRLINVRDSNATPHSGGK